MTVTEDDDDDVTRRDKSRTSLVLFQLTLLIRRMRRPWTVCCVCRHKTRVNLQIRAHITTYYHLQIVITNDHRLGMALVMDGRLWCLIRSPPGAGCVAFLVRRIGCQPASQSQCQCQCSSSMSRNAYITFWSLSFLILVRGNVQDVVI